MHAAPIVFAIFLLIATLFAIYPPADTQPQVRHHAAEHVLNNENLTGYHRFASR